MSCNLCSDLGGTNIRSHGWTKSSLRPTATAYQKHWEPPKKAETGWFWSKATPNFSWEARFDVTYSHQKTVLDRDFRRGESFNNQIQKFWWKVFRSLVSEASSSETAPYKLFPKNAKTPCPREKTFSLIGNNEVLKKWKTNHSKHHFKLEFRETANFRKRNWNELQFVFRFWWYQHQESRMDKIITPTNSNCVPKTLRAIKEGWDWLVLTQSDTQRFLRGKVWCDLFPSKDSSWQGFSPWREFQQPNSEFLVESLPKCCIKLHHLKRHLTNYLQKTRKLRVHARRPFHWFKTTKSSRSGKPTIHNIISNWNSARQQILGKETEMSCNLCSDLGGTNIRSHGWTKSSLRPTATAYQKHWEPPKKAETGWFWSKATPNFSWEARFDATYSHQKTVLDRDFRRGERFNNQTQKFWWKVFRSLVSEASSSETAPYKLFPKNAKTPCPREKTFSLIGNNEVLKKWETNHSKHHFKLEFRETANFRKRNWNELQFVFRFWWYQHQESRMDKIITPTNSNCVPKTLRAIKEGWDWLVLTQSDTQRFLRSKVWYDLFPSKDSSCQGFSPWREFQQPNSEILVESLPKSCIRSFIIWNVTSQIISKKRENFVSTREDLFIDSKQRNPQEVENQRSITSFQTGVPRDSKF